MSQHLWPLFLFFLSLRGFKLPCTVGSNPPLSRTSSLLKTTVTVYHRSMIYSLVFVEKGRFRCLYSTSICVLSGCGGNTEKPTSKQNSCMCSLSVCPPPQAIFFTASLSISRASSSLALFFPLHQTPPPSLPVSLWPSSSSAWEKLTVVSPEKL